LRKYWKFIQISLFIFACSAEATVRENSDRICVDRVCSQVEMFKSQTLASSPVLVVSLHGDSPFTRPSYHYRFAKRIAAESKNVISVGILRPGYTDDFNRTSDGDRGESVGDNYDNKRVLQVANVIEMLSKTYKARSVVLAGHSGGSAIAAKIISLKPNVVDSAFIVSCPCDINLWRADMFKRNQFLGFKGDIDVSSPIDLVSQVGSDTDVYVYIGNSDDVTQPYLSNQYHNALIKAGKRSTQHVIDGSHDVFQSESVVMGVLSVVESYNKPNKKGVNLPR